MPFLAVGLRIQPSEAHLQRTRRSVNAQIQQELSSVISSTSIIMEPNDADWANETERYMQSIKPRVQLSVRPGREDDVAVIVSVLTSIAHPVLTILRLDMPTNTISRSTQSAVATP